jgi:FixJ family two-component response regulator
MKLRHPQLNDSEVITAYYLFMGFKNKEIAVFLNISVRAMESRRYRISKKINLGTKQTTLVDYLKSTFKDLRVR